MFEKDHFARLGRARAQKLRRLRAERAPHDVPGDRERYGEHRRDGDKPRHGLHERAHGGKEQDRRKSGIDDDGQQGQPHRHADGAGEQRAAQRDEQVLARDRSASQPERAVAADDGALVLDHARHRGEHHERRDRDKEHGKDERDDGHFVAVRFEGDAARVLLGGEKGVCRELLFELRNALLYKGVVLLRKVFVPRRSLKGQVHLRDGHEGRERAQRGRGQIRDERKRAARPPRVPLPAKTGAGSPRSP